VRELQRYGGKMAVVFDDINRWFASLWHGKSLALTVAFLSFLAAFALFFTAFALPEDRARD
jgi:LPS O-antigen subunit length determinant protein (WzzB/FepE family)